MTKYEFLEQLGAALSGEVPSQEINSQLDYYNNYINEKSTNINEEEVVEELGNPRLIAKTIIDAYERAYGDSYKGNNYHDQWNSSAYSSSSNYNEDFSNYSKSSNQGDSRQTIKIPWYVKLLITLIIALIFMLVIILGTVLIRIILIVIPIFIVSFFIIFLIRLFRNI